MKTTGGAAAKSQVETEGQIQHMLKGNAELNEGDASLLEEADGLLHESKEVRERARVLVEDKEAMPSYFLRGHVMIFSRRRRRSRTGSFH